MSINKIISRMEQTVQEGHSQCQMLFIIRVGDRLTIRDNSKVCSISEDTVDLIENAMDDMFCKAGAIGAVKKDD